MAVQPIAAAVSQERPEHGQRNRSGPNFRFLKVPASGNITVFFLANPNPESIEAVLVHDKGGSNDVIIAPLVEGGTFPADKVKAKGDYEYYIATPDHVLYNFVVLFQGDV